MFDSKKEAARYAELKLLERAGQIHMLELQTKFPIEIKGKKCFTYKADFTYITALGEFIIEDVKGVLTPMYKLKKKCVEAYYGHPIFEV
jgi:hypothetical protein